MVLTNPQNRHFKFSIRAYQTKKVKVSFPEKYSAITKRYTKEKFYAIMLGEASFEMGQLSKKNSTEADCTVEMNTEDFQMTRVIVVSSCTGAVSRPEMQVVHVKDFPSYIQRLRNDPSPTLKYGNEPINRNRVSNRASVVSKNKKKDKEVIVID